MTTKTFNSWLACYLQQSEEEVTKLLEDKTAIQFLIAWSLLEVACFRDSVNFNEINKFATDKARDGYLITNEFNQLVSFFHDRYQNKKLYRELMYKQSCEKVSNLRRKNFSEFSSDEKIFFSMVVVYRYRNNIFHGNKGVNSWLGYRDCILNCIAIMQLLIPIPGDHLYND